MRLLSAQDIINIWESGRNQHPLDRALTILSAGKPETKWDQLAALSIGQRDRSLLDLREKTFGPTLAGFAECSKCTEPLEFATSVNELRIVQESSSDGKEDSRELVVDKMKLNFRLPNSIDIATVVDIKDVQTAQSLIVERCIQGVISNGKHVNVKELSARAVNKLAKRMAECDPQAEILLDLQCPACSHTWQITFDIVTFLWKEISVHAKRLLREVHALAFAYKWSEEDILTMNPVRRKYYLEMLT